MKNDITHIGKYITKLLRHDPEDLVMDKNGWVSIKSLIDKLSITLSTLDLIVSTDSKGRLSYDTSKTKIRANQGHSIQVDVELMEIIPPQFLYHGTSSKFVESIMKDGIKSMSRNHVHLSVDIDIATSVGDRHTKSKNSQTTILKIDSEVMYNDGYKFYLSSNGVYLIDYIPNNYITIHNYVRED